MNQQVPANEQMEYGARTLFHVDRINETGVFGWARDPDDNERRQTIEILLDGRVVDTVIADRFRRDLENKGHGDGCYSFAWHFDEAHAGILRSRFSARLMGSQQTQVDIRQPASIGQLGGVVKMLSQQQEQLAPLNKQVRKLTGAQRSLSSEAKEEIQRLRKDMAMLESLLVKWDREQTEAAENPVGSKTPWLALVMASLFGGLIGAICALAWMG
ncbi:MAG: hypothetical protein AAF556_09140 [Pseudomonadota bacterium]